MLSVARVASVIRALVLLAALAGVGTPLGAAVALRVVATTPLVADLVREVGGPRVSVRSLMGPGVDPHSYQPTPSDLRALQEADVVAFHGLLLEGRMEGVLQRLRTRRERVFAITADLAPAQLRQVGEGASTVDPHVWFDVRLWRDCVEPVVRALSQADPAGTGVYRARADDLRQRLSGLDAWVREALAVLPPERRVLVTSHDAFGYFGRAYHFEVVGLQGISTVGEAALSAMAELTQFLTRRRVPAIFVESSVSPKAIQRVAADAGIRVGGQLYSDSLGPPGQTAEGLDPSTYEGMVRHNVRTLVAALR
ncbi:MAG: ABC transporter substrate-binding protein [Verrucomicrobia bacterium]|nr:ABC transporter substrate-binding protein [Verrucomicrobiota bacterium]